MKPSILFMGTPEFARTSLETLWTEGYPILAVVTQPDRPAGRGQIKTASPCAQFAKQKNFPLLQPENLKNDPLVPELTKLHPDFIVVAAYGVFLPQKIIDAASIATINIHASLLPKYRGAAPINWAIIRGESETGVSIMKIIPKMDAGPVYAQDKIPIAPQDTAVSLREKLSRMGARLLLKTLPLILEGKITAHNQDKAQASLAPVLKKEDGKMDWNRPATDLHNLIRGTLPWPGAHTLIDNKNLKIYASALNTDSINFPPGVVYLVNDEGIHVACGVGSLCLKEVQLEGRKRMSAAEFSRGYRLREGTRLT